VSEKNRSVNTLSVGTKVAGNLESVAANVQESSLLSQTAKSIGKLVNRSVLVAGVASTVASAYTTEVSNSLQTLSPLAQSIIERAKNADAKSFSHQESLRNHQRDVSGNAYALFVENPTADGPKVSLNRFAKLEDTFASSDRLLSILNYDNRNTLQRLGDGFYETQLVRDAIMAQTGRRFINGVSSDKEQYLPFPTLSKQIIKLKILPQSFE
jgi:hypothetical protein